MEHEEITLHGHRVSYRRAGWGPVIVLIHGITGSSLTWEDVIEPLAEHYTVVAPDLLGHGESAKPRGDYSLGAYASGVRDLVQAIGHDRATVVGHSLGGGVAMQFAYQFPERCERLVGARHAHHRRARSAVGRGERTRRQDRLGRARRVGLTPRAAAASGRAGVSRPRSCRRSA